MSRISRIERLQRGQRPRFNHSSLEHILQKVCPHGINAAPFFLPMHTQHIESFPICAPPFPSSSSSSNSLINDTLIGVPGALIPTSPPSRAGTARKCRSAAKASARFMPDETGAGLMQPGSGLCQRGQKVPSPPPKAVSEPKPPMATTAPQAQTAVTSTSGVEKLRDQKVPSPPPKAVTEAKPQMATAVPQAQTAVASDSSIEKQRDQKVPSPPKAVTEPKPPMATAAPQSQTAAASPQKQAKGKKKVEALPPLKKQEETQKKVYPIGDNTAKQAEEKSTGGSGPTTSTTPGIVDKKGETETKDGLKDLVKEQKTKDSMSEAGVPKASEKAGVETKPQEGGGGLLEKAKEMRGMGRIMKSVKRLTSDEDEDRQLLINIGVSVLVIVALGAYITYSYRSSGKAKH